MCLRSSSDSRPFRIATFKRKQLVVVPSASVLHKPGISSLLLSVTTLLSVTAVKTSLHTEYSDSILTSNSFLSVSLCVSVCACVCVCAVSYTHLTLPTRR